MHTWQITVRVYIWKNTLYLRLTFHISRYLPTRKDPSHTQPTHREQTRAALPQELGGFRLALQLMSRTGTQWTAPQSSRPPKACRRLQPPRRTCHATSTPAIRARENPSPACPAPAHAAGCASRPTSSRRPRSRSLAQVLLMHFTMKSAGGVDGEAVNVA